MEHNHEHQPADPQGANQHAEHQAHKSSLMMVLQAKPSS